MSNNNTIESIFSGIDPNDGAEFATEEILIEKGDKYIKAFNHVRLELLPQPAINFKLTFPTEQDIPPTVLAMESEGKLIFPSRNTTAEVFYLNRTFSSDKPIRIDASLKNEPLVIKSDKKNSYIVFHLFNFWDFWASSFPFKHENSKKLSGNRLILLSGDWKITLESLPQTKERIDFLKKNGGYGITHVGKIERVNAKSFTYEIAEEIIESLFYFFTFVRGFWVHPALQIGYNKKNEKVLEVWGIGPVNAWQAVLSWFDPHNGKFLLELFPGFMNRWQDLTWKETIKAAIYWYAIANSLAARTDGSIVLIQAALERLTWEYHVNYEASISEKTFEKKSASERIKMLLSQANIPLSIPDELEAMQSFANEKNIDGPTAFTYIRNRIVHPRKRKGSIESAKAPIFECWNIGLWYLELLLLYLFAYDGKYANRLKLNRWLGDVENLPWAIPDLTLCHIYQ